MSKGVLELNTSGPIWRVAMNRVRQGNALSPRLVAEMHEVFDRAEREGAQAVVLEGLGKHFCTGFDLSDLAAESDDSLLARFVRVELLLQRIARTPLLTVAVARGNAIGAGADLYVACRLRLVDGEAGFSFPGAHGFGLMLGTRRLAALVGCANALRWIETARNIPLAEALEAGLVKQVINNADAVSPLVAEQLMLPSHTTAELQAVLEPDARAHDARDLEMLVRSAARPGLKGRISTYVERVTAARHASRSR